jgi:tetratricopeptide (TPR) repeat protein
MKLENYYDRIDLYHAGELSEKDRQSFENELNSNVELRQADELYRLSLKALDYGVEESLRQDLKKWEQTRQQTPISGGGRIFNLRRSLLVLSAAAAVLLLVFFARPFLLPAPNADELFSAYYEAPDGASMRGENLPQNALSAAKTALAEQSYADAIEELSKINSSDPLYVEAQYYLGHALVGLNNFSAAKNAFDVAANSNESKFKDKGEWFYLLACLKAKQWNEVCAAKLQTIAQNGDHSFASQAQKLLKQMK